MSLTIKMHFHCLFFSLVCSLSLPLSLTHARFFFLALLCHSLRNSISLQRYSQYFLIRVGNLCSCVCVCMVYSKRVMSHAATCVHALQRVTTRCRGAVVQFLAIQCVAVRCSVLQCVAVCCNVVQSCSGAFSCIPARCSVL